MKERYFYFYCNPIVPNWRKTKYVEFEGIFQLILQLVVKSILILRKFLEEINVWILDSQGTNIIDDMIFLIYMIVEVAKSLICLYFGIPIFEKYWNEQNLEEEGKCTSCLPVFFNWS